MLSLIAAVSENNCIGKDGTLPWHLPEDMKHFRTVTDGKPVIMGRKTWESIPDKFRPLPNRKNIVITRQQGYAVPKDVSVFDTIDAAIQSQADVEEIMIIGGAELYRQTIEQADRLYITKVHQFVDGDSFFPVIDLTTWHITETRDSDNLTFITYERI